MNASVFYRIAAVLLLLFAVAHTFGFRQSDPQWGIDALLGSMRSIHFDVQGFNRTYWDIFEAAGFSVGVFYLFTAILAWQLGGLPADALANMGVVAWAFALCFGAITGVSWRYLFIPPIVFSLTITVCLISAAWLSSKQSAALRAPPRVNVSIG
jgi:ribose/xylose/arabinose/galactoside ABC-type transport system permease subunit